MCAGCCAVAPRIRNRHGQFFRNTGRDATTLAKSRKVIERALTGGRSLTNASELVAALK
jgi:hypothetical protein